MTHSPAPWTAFLDPMRRWTIGTATHRICDMWGKDPAFYTAEDEANARLIAAAPALIECLIALLDEESEKGGEANWDWTRFSAADPTGNWHSARQAVDKATAQKETA